MRNKNKYILLCGVVCVFSKIDISHSHTIDSVCDRDKDDVIAQEIPCLMRMKHWDFAADLMEYWFTDPVNRNPQDNPNLEWENRTFYGDNIVINFQDILKTTANQSVITNVVDKMKDAKYISSDKKDDDGVMIRDYLLQNLNRDSFLYEKAGNEIVFDYISKESDLIKDSNSKWMKYEEEAKIMYWTGEEQIPIHNDLNQEFTGAFNYSALRLTVKGKLTFLKDSVAAMTITNGGIYFKDSYDFVDEGPISQYLGCWTRDEPYVYKTPFHFCTSIYNSNFFMLDTKLDHDYRIFTDPENNRFSYPEPVSFYVRVNNDGKLEYYNPSIGEQVVSFAEMEKKFEEAEMSYNGDLGTSSGTHCWSDPGDNPTCIGGVWIRDYTGGIYGDGTSAIIYNPDKRKAYLIKEGFWGYYKLFEGYKRLGPPTGDVETLDDGRTKQKFENGYLIWSPNSGLSYPAWGITQYDNNHEVVYPNGGGSGTSTQPTPDDLPVPGLPDFITDKVTIANQSGSKEKYTWKINETAYVHSWTDNIGDANWQGSADKIKVPFYLSKGSKEDDHSEWVRIDRQQISKDNLKINKQPKHEYIKFDLKDWADDSTVLPGRNYNFVVCADRPKDEDNGDGDVKEKHKSNNCSTEAVFYVDYGPPRNVDLLARNLALTGGRSSLQAGEKYGLQVEVSNIGTEQPWNGFSTNYEIKGPSTGGVWQKIGEDTSRASSLYPNATHFESMTDAQEVSAPMVGGDYVFRACADYSQAVPETDESNNCTDELPVYIAPPPMPDLITEGLQLTHGRTSLIAGELYGLTVAIRNIGNATPSSNIRSSYAIKGPGTNDQWQQVADDGSDADQLYPGAAQWEEITDEHGAHIPSAPGTYTARACADYHGSVPESDENNNCSEMTFEVQPVPAGSPTITVTNPTHDDEWRSDERKHIEWTSENFSSQERVKIEYSLDGGKTWDLVDDTAVNDGGKYWDMCEFHTEDTDDAFIRVTSLKYPYVYDDSDEFTIDHAKECK